LKILKKGSKVLKIHLYIPSTLFGMGDLQKGLEIRRIGGRRGRERPLFRPPDLKREEKSANFALSNETSDTTYHFN
jgi:hypothetical protein